jgi:hypothetical protein
MQTIESEQPQMAPALTADYYLRIKGMGWNTSSHPNPPIVTSTFTSPPVVEVLTSSSGLAYYKLTLPGAFNFLIASVYKRIEDSPRQDVSLRRDEHDDKVWYVDAHSDLTAVFCLHIRRTP